MSPAMIPPSCSGLTSVNGSPERNRLANYKENAYIFVYKYGRSLYPYIRQRNVFTLNLPQVNTVHNFLYLTTPVANGEHFS